MDGYLFNSLTERGTARGRGAPFSLLTTHNEEFHFPSPDKLITGTKSQSDY